MGRRGTIFFRAPLGTLLANPGRAVPSGLANAVRRRVSIVLPPGKGTRLLVRLIPGFCSAAVISFLLYQAIQAVYLRENRWHVVKLDAGFPYHRVKINQTHTSTGFVGLLVLWWFSAKFLKHDLPSRSGCIP